MPYSKHNSSLVDIVCTIQAWIVTKPTRYFVRQRLYAVTAPDNGCAQCDSYGLPVYGRKRDNQEKL